MNGPKTNCHAALVRCGWFTASTVGLWILLLFPAWSMAGPAGLEGLLYAALLCLIPGWLTFGLTARAGGAGTRSALVVMSGSVLRLVFVLLGTLVVQSVREDLRFREFLIWLLVFYMATLLIETLLVLKHPKSKNERTRATEPEFRVR